MTIHTCIHACIVTYTCTCTCTYSIAVCVLIVVQEQAVLHLWSFMKQKMLPDGWKRFWYGVN